jgi:hypothetical protein
MYLLTSIIFRPRCGLLCELAILINKPVARYRLFGLSRSSHQTPSEEPSQVEALP